MYHNTDIARFFPKHNPGHVSLSHSQAFLIYFWILSKKTQSCWKSKNLNTIHWAKIFHFIIRLTPPSSSLTALLPSFFPSVLFSMSWGSGGLLFFKVLLGGRKKRWGDPNTWSREAPEMVACLMLKYNSIHRNKSVSTNVLFKEAWIFKSLISPSPPAEFCHSKLNCCKLVKQSPYFYKQVWNPEWSRRVSGPVLSSVTRLIHRLWCSYKANPSFNNQHTTSTPLHSQGLNLDPGSARADNDPD